MDKIFDKATLSIRLSEDLVNKVDEYYEFITDTSEKVTDKELFVKILDKAINKTVPIIALKTENEQLKASKAAFLVQIEQLKAENSELKQEITKTNTQIQEAINAVAIADNEVNTLKSLLSQREAEVELLREVTKIQENQVIVTLSPFVRKLIDNYLKRKEVVTHYTRANENGKFTGLINKPETPADLLINAFVYAASGFCMQYTTDLQAIKKQFLKS